MLSSKVDKAMSDEDIVIKYLETQNVAYFDILYRRYSGKVFGKCLSILKNESSAEDAMQDVFMKILLSLSKYSGKSKFSTWLYSITYNYCIDMIRRKKRDKSILAEDVSNHYDKEDDVNDSYLLELSLKRLKVVLEKIPAYDKAILLMKYQDGMSIKEISEILEKTESAIKMRIKRAKQKFKIIHKSIFAEA